ncbi:MAG: hypothetical protein ABFC94_00260 [Syntrophomonas sp.]
MIDQTADQNDLEGSKGSQYVSFVFSGQLISPPLVTIIYRKAISCNFDNV